MSNTTIKLKRIDLKEGVQVPGLGMTKVVNAVSPEGKKAALELDESRGIVKVAVEKQEPICIFRENITAFREHVEPAKVEAKK